MSLNNVAHIWQTGDTVTAERLNNMPFVVHGETTGEPQTSDNAQVLSLELDCTLVEIANAIDAGRNIKLNALIDYDFYASLDLLSGDDEMYIFSGHFMNGIFNNNYNQSTVIAQVSSEESQLIIIPPATSDTLIVNFSVLDGADHSYSEILEALEDGKLVECHMYSEGQQKVFTDVFVDGEHIYFRCVVSRIDAINNTMNGVEHVIDMQRNSVAYTTNNFSIDLKSNAPK